LALNRQLTIFPFWQTISVAKLCLIICPKELLDFVKEYPIFKGYFKIVTKRQSVISVYELNGAAAGWSPI
jgi:hypothetical protein